MTPFEFSRLSEEALRLGLAGELTTSTTTASAQKLVSLQASPFIKVAMSKTALFPLIPDSNKIAITSPTIELPRITREARSTSGGLGETAQVADADKMAVTFDSRSATPAPFELSLQMTRRFTIDNVERAQIESTLEQLAVESYAEDMEEAAIRGDTGGANPSGYPAGLLTTISGYETKMTASANTLYSDGSYVGEALFQDIIDTLPVERRGTVTSLVQKGYQFFMPVQTADAWVRRLQARATDLGDSSILSDGRPAYRGIPINALPHMPVDYDGAAGQAVSNISASFCRIWLLPPSALYVYYNPVMFVHRGVHAEHGKILYYYLYTAMDVQIDMPENCVIAHDVYPTKLT